MKKIKLFGMIAALTLSMGITVSARDDSVVKDGVYVEDVNLSGMDMDQARIAVSDYVSEITDTTIVFVAADENEVEVTAGELGMKWLNTDVVDRAFSVGKEGNIIQRYKALKDLEQDDLVLALEFEFDQQNINDIILEKCTKFDRKAVNVSLERENGEFRVVEGQTGYKVDVEASATMVKDFLTEQWDHKECSIPLEIEVDEPVGSVEELAQIKDILGTFTTSYSTSGAARSANVANGCALINGITLYPGEEFSTYETVSPFSEANGYYMAGSYVNGKVVDSLGGGICQVSTTLYNAVLLSELEVTERHNHSMIVSYVDPSADAAIAESAGKDFRFVNNTDYPIYIEGYTQNKKITFNIYGKETRDEGRKVKYESEVLEVNNPTSDVIYADASQPIGYIVTESAHIGYKARLWKIVTEDGVQVSKTEVNSSTYKLVPRSATVGTATDDPNAYNEIMAAIGTNNIDHIKNVIAILTAPAPNPEEVPIQ